MIEQRATLLVIGGGPGGYVCASRAARMGVDTMLVEARKLGGTCLNVGCIPSKALIHVAQEYRRAQLQAQGHFHGICVSQPELDFSASQDWIAGIVSRLVLGVGGLLERSGVKSVTGKAHFVDGKTVEIESETGKIVVHADNIVIATGSEPAELPCVPFAGAVIDSTAALSLETPPERLVVIGAGYIGLELGTAFAKLGSKVTLVEAADRILPQYDEKLTRLIRRRLASFDINLHLGTRVTGWSETAGLLSVETEVGPAQIGAEKVLIAVGRVPNTRGLALNELSLRTDRGFIEVDDCCRTGMRGVYAIGDVTPGPMLAHRAMAQAEIVADLVAGRANAWDRVCVPEVCFTDPELVSVGLSQKEAEATGACAASEFSFRASGRAMTLDDAEGFVRIIARESDHVILGMQAVGPGVSELSGEFSLAIEAGLRAEDLASTIHAHPTLGEAIQEAALATASMANHG